LKVFYTATFIKELKKIPEPWRNKIEKIVFQKEINFKTLKAKKLAGYEEYYRVRIGPYRIGIKKAEDTIIFCRVLHRKDIYKKFP